MKALLILVSLLTLAAPASYGETDPDQKILTKVKNGGDTFRLFEARTLNSLRTADKVTPSDVIQLYGAVKGLAQVTDETWKMAWVDHVTAPALLLGQSLETKALENRLQKKENDCIELEKRVDSLSNRLTRLTVYGLLLCFLAVTSGTYMLLLRARLERLAKGP